MLYLGGGTREVKVGERLVPVFPDFSDPNQFYYLPNFPHVASMEDGTPAIRLLIYRGDPNGPGTDPNAVGFLSLDVDLSWPADVIERAARKLQSEDRLKDPPRLTPIFFSKGSVKLMLLDAVTPEPDPAHPTGEIRPTQFVASILGAASPSLYGDNRAIFQPALTQKGAQALAAALDGVTPIGVVYSLTFAGLQPAFKVKAKVDWQKVYDHFSEEKNLNLMFVEVDIQKSIDKLVEQKAITLDVTVEGIGAEAMDAEREQAMTVIRQLVFDKFFEATLKPVAAAGQGTGDQVVDAVTGLARNAITLGVGYSYKRKEVTIEELRTLDIDWTARKAAERTIYPQAHMYNVLSNSGLTKDKLVTFVDSQDDVWTVLPLEVMAAAAWEADGIAGITVDIEYEDRGTGAKHDMSVFLDKDHTRIVKKDWMDRTSGDEFCYKYEVVFQDGGIVGPSAKVNSGSWRPHKGTVLVVTPRDLYEAVELEVAAVPDFPFAHWPAVQAILRYRADDGSFEHYEDGVLTAGAKSFKTRFRVDRGKPGRREVQLNYIGATGRHITTPWMPMYQDQYVVEEMDPRKLSVRALVAGNRKNIANLLVDFQYDDDENGVHESGQLTFGPDNMNNPLTWTINVADPDKRRYLYSMTLVTAAGDFLQTGWISTDAPSLPVGEVYVRKLSVDLVTGELDSNVEAVEVAVAYHDAAGNVHDEQTFRLGPKSRSQWQVNLQDASKRSYKMTTTWIRPDGFNPKVGPVTTDQTYVVIPGSPPR